MAVEVVKSGDVIVEEVWAGRREAGSCGLVRNGVAARNQLGRVVLFDLRVCCFSVNEVVCIELMWGW